MADDVSNLTATALVFVVAVCGSIIVIVPPAKLILFDKNNSKGVPEATDPVADPPLLPSISILPPV